MKVLVLVIKFNGNFNFMTVCVLDEVCVVPFYIMPCVLHRLIQSTVRNTGKTYETHSALPLMSDRHINLFNHLRYHLLQYGPKLTTCINMLRKHYRDKKIKSWSLMENVVT